MRTFSGRLLETHLKTAGIKPRELAHALGTDAGTIYRYQRGESRPLSDRAARIADLLGVDINELYDTPVSDEENAPAFRGPTSSELPPAPDSAERHRQPRHRPSRLGGPPDNRSTHQ